MSDKKLTLPEINRKYGAGGPQEFQPKDQDPIPEIYLDHSHILDALDHFAKSIYNTIPLNQAMSSIDNPDIEPFQGHPTDDSWSYQGDYEKAKNKEKTDKIDYEKDAENFVRKDKKPLTNKEKADIINKIAWSD